MMQLFEYWPGDPNGYLRHIFAGAVLVLLAVPFKHQEKSLVTFVLITLIATSKEVVDVSRNGHFDILDIVFTVVPYLFIKTYSSMKNLLLLIATVFVFAACQKPEYNVVQVLRIKEGEHRATPWHYEWNKTTYRAYRWMLTESCIYNYQDSDQCDWDKLTGAAHNLFTNFENSAMTATRWDTINQLFQVAPYYHKGGNVYHPGGVPCFVENHIADTSMRFITVAAGEWFETHEYINEDLDRHGFYVVNPQTGDYYDFEQVFDEFTRTREIGPWKGGNRKAQRDMIILRLLTAEEK